jgi:uncharacterized DUF497 family protein
MRDNNFEWDERKAADNYRKHGVTFELARVVFDDPCSVERQILMSPTRSGSWSLASQASGF